MLTSFAIWLARRRCLHRIDSNRCRRLVGHMTTITLDYDPEGDADWPRIIPLLDRLKIEYDEDDGSASAPNGDAFQISLYPRAGCIRFDSDGEVCEAVFVILMNLPPTDTKVRVLLQDDEYDEGISMDLKDLLESLLEDD